MQRFRIALVPALAAVGALLLAGCGEGGARGDSDGQAGTSKPGGKSSATAAGCDNEELKATETGITKDTINIHLGADTGAQAIPGMANGSVEAVKAWAELMNSEGGLACRQVKVSAYDTKIDPTESRNAMIEACQKSFAMVGSFMLAVADAAPLSECADKSGAKTGLPDIPGTAQGSVHACNKSTFLPAGAGGQPCPAVKGQQKVTQPLAYGDYLQSAVGKGANGAYVIANTSPATVQAIVPLYTMLQEKQGFTADLQTGAKGSDPKTHYTPMAQTMKDKKSKFALSSMSFPGFILLRQEAATQGVNSVDKWICQATCYDPAFVKAGGDLVIGSTALITHLPYEEKDANDELALFTEKVKTHNTFSTPSWVASRLFQKAVEDVVAKDGPNGLTRSALTEALKAVDSFDNEGMVAKNNPSAKIPPPCLVAVELQKDGSWKRTWPEKRGTMHCAKMDDITLDPSTAFKG
ncbi:ABC transporter substrate-binding protein [Streptomyces albipurpureus]|uniref:ABC transporter substrate-binding protein n=1 Tax=Streptomyces albipurpureus TaxID=2897419 RepID=A0ABT0ULZ5_9ACTN|nr:ABC transporter substrate-binding protein [Streptomyces sp. CWNU-1]MCM2389638.1 ABC transporter substrate-binding protein [Streptomyces sp. CWNU-1]